MQMMQINADDDEEEGLRASGPHPLLPQYENII